MVSECSGLKGLRAGRKACGGTVGPGIHGPLVGLFLRTFGGKSIQRARVDVQQDLLRALGLAVGGGQHEGVVGVPQNIWQNMNMHTHTYVCMYM